jgi:hypothetical protein
MKHFLYLATFVALRTDDELVADVTAGIVDNVAPLVPSDDADVDDDGVGCVLWIWSRAKN